MEWRKGDYMIQGTWDGTVKCAKATGYIYELCEGLMIGITNKMPVDGVKWRPAGFWTMSILPEGLAFKTFKTKKAAGEYIEKHETNLAMYIADCRRRRNNGSVDTAHDEW